MTTGSFRIGTQVPQKSRHSPNNTRQIKSNSPFRSATNQSGKISFRNSARNMGQSLASKQSKRSASKSRSPAASQQTQDSTLALDRYCESRKLTKTQKDNLVKTFNLQKYLAYKRSIRNSERSPARILKNGVPASVNERPSDEDIQ